MSRSGPEYGGCEVAGREAEGLLREELRIVLVSSWWYIVHVRRRCKYCRCFDAHVSLGYS